ncbi:hypothetical protein ACISK3_10650 [Morganella morganii]|nr:hypothetical protein [Morganella morganii]
MFAAALLCPEENRVWTLCFWVVKMVAPVLKTQEVVAIQDADLLTVFRILSAAFRAGGRIKTVGPLTWWQRRAKDMI